MIHQKIEDALNCIRETRDEADTLEGHILFFLTLLMVVTGSIAVLFTLCLLVFMLPRVFLPMYFSIFILWQVYKRL